MAAATAFTLSFSAANFALRADADDFEDAGAGADVDGFVLFLLLLPLLLLLPSLVVDSAMVGNTQFEGYSMSLAIYPKV